MKDNVPISFYNVPLVCNAATSIGCGSRSKPVLQDLEKQAAISQAWLNRKGTAIAVVWNPTFKKSQRATTANKVFTANHINATEIIGNEYDADLNSFKIPNQWLQGNDVNKLSKEEAGVIASQLIKVYKQKSPLNSFQENGIKNEIQKVFYNFFLNYKSLDQLADTKVYRQKMIEINKLSEKYILKNNLPSIENLLSECTGHSENCNQKSISKEADCSGKSCNVKTT